MFLMMIKLVRSCFLKPVCIHPITMIPYMERVMNLQLIGGMPQIPKVASSRLGKNQQEREDSQTLCYLRPHLIRFLRSDPLL
jgi:hypothetical protein